MPKVVGGILALFALGASILSQVDPVTSLVRGGIAYGIGVILTQLWYVFFTIRVNPEPDRSSQAEQAPPA